MKRKKSKAKSKAALIADVARTAVAFRSLLARMELRLGHVEGALQTAQAAQTLATAAIAEANLEIQQQRAALDLLFTPENSPAEGEGP